MVRNSNTFFFHRQTFTLSLMKVRGGGMDERGGEYWRASTKIGWKYFVLLWLLGWWTLPYDLDCMHILPEPHVFQASGVCCRSVGKSSISCSPLFFLSTQLSLLTQGSVWWMAIQFPLQGQSAAPPWSCKAGASKWLWFSKQGLMDVELPYPVVLHIRKIRTGRHTAIR